MPQAGREGSYSVSVSPFKQLVCGIPIGTLVATCSAVLLYLVCIILILSTKCPFVIDVVYFFSFLWIAITATVAMAILNIYYHKYRFNCLSLTVSLFYSGSAALIAFGLVLTAYSGLCQEEKEKPVSLFKSTNLVNYFVWFLSAIGLCFQVVAHYFYG